MKKVVSFSLWGTSEIYLCGAVDAIAQVNQHYPGWEPRFYLGADVPQATRQKLLDRGASVFDGPSWGPWAGMYWRFLAAADPNVDVMISRDVDTLILEREVQAVNEWLASGKTLHIMRDHPKHEVPIMGGMWGCRTGFLRNIEQLIHQWNRFNRYGCDQEFLARVIYPQFRDQAWIHSECIHFPHETLRAFPTTRERNQVIGMALRGQAIIDLQMRYLKEWQDAGCPYLSRPHPWSFFGRIRKLTRGRWPGESLDVTATAK
ncbi:MAG: hypothetical protein DVB26_08395 [Verrucomicrobia bacterium]|nr:MAG: hypothetical protein DVB26_08395 [Verrucomicrobiota bacterium]